MLKSITIQNFNHGSNKHWLSAVIKEINIMYNTKKVIKSPAEKAHYLCPLLCRFCPHPKLFPNLIAQRICQLLQIGSSQKRRQIMWILMQLNLGWLSTFGKTWWIVKASHLMMILKTELDLSKIIMSCSSDMVFGKVTWPSTHKHMSKYI